MKTLIWTVSVTLALAFTDPAFAGDVTKATDAISCHQANGIWYDTAKKCSEPPLVETRDPDVTKATDEISCHEANGNWDDTAKKCSEPPLSEIRYPEQLEKMGWNCKSDTGVSFDTGLTCSKPGERDVHCPGDICFVPKTAISK